jgi:hypothetical protein
MTSGMPRSIVAPGFGVFTQRTRRRSGRDDDAAVGGDAGPAGWDRAFARRAFYGELPKEVANRKETRAMGQHLRNILDRNITFIGELLFDGASVQKVSSIHLVSIASMAFRGQAAARQP